MLCFRISTKCCFLFWFCSLDFFSLPELEFLYLEYTDFKAFMHTAHKQEALGGNLVK